MNSIAEIFENSQKRFSNIDWTQYQAAKYGIIHYEEGVDFGMIYWGGCWNLE